MELLLAIQGAFILLVSMIGGVFFAKAIQKGRGEVAWRVVHSGGSMAGVMLLAFVPILPMIALPQWGLYCFVGASSIGTWLLVLGMIVAALTNSRGLEVRDEFWNRVVRSLYQLGTVFSFIGVLLLIAGLVAAF